MGSRASRELEFVERKINDEIEQTLELEKREHTRDESILHWNGRAGTSSFFHQFKVKFGSELKDPDCRSSYTWQIHRNAILEMQTLCRQIESFKHLPEANADFPLKDENYSHQSNILGLNLNSTLSRLDCSGDEYYAALVEKWIHHFDFVRRVVFVVSLADGKHSVANSDNYLSNAVVSFQETASELNWAHLILVLNKKDLFEEQLKHTPMAQL
jgi:hypothetical protein